MPFDEQQAAGYSNGKFAAMAFSNPAAGNAVKDYS